MEQVLKEQLDNVHIDNAHKLVPLQRHRYPFGVKALGVVTIALYVLLLPRFLWIELPSLKRVKNEIRTADTFFAQKNYVLAGVAYDQLYKSYPEFRYAYLQVIKSCFALADQDSGFYQSGLNYMVGEKFSSKELQELKFFLPKMYKKEFKFFLSMNSSYKAR